MSVMSRYVHAEGFALGYVFTSLVFFVPFLAYAETVRCINSYNVYQEKTYTLPEGTLNPGPNQLRSVGPNPATAAGDIDKTFFTPELSEFNDSNCGGSPCRNDLPGLAHRTWPKGSCVAVCNVQSKICAVAVIMDHGPNVALGCRTIDANPTLRRVLNMKSGLVPATYKLLSLPGKPCDLGSAGGGIIGTSDINLNDLNMSNSRSPLYSDYGAYSGYGSALGGSGASPFALGGGGQSPFAMGSGEQGMSVSTGQGAYASQGAQSSGGTAGTGGTSSGGNSSGAPGPAEATIVAQSSTASRGKQVVISWSSIGMRSDQKCRLTISLPQAEALTVTEENQGSQPVRISLTAAQGTAMFRLRCTPLLGQPIEKSVPVVIQ